MAGDNQQPDKETAKAIQQHAGDDFLVTTVHVARDVKGSDGKKAVKSIEGGRLVSELKGEEKLSGDEVDELTKAGAIRAATADDVRAAVARAAAREAAESARERARAMQGVDAEQAAERQAIIDKHNAARDKELAGLTKSMRLPAPRWKRSFRPPVARASK
jgi:hypothetical protein